MALAAPSGYKAIAELSSGFGVHQTLIHKWVKQLKESAAGIGRWISFYNQPRPHSSLDGATPEHCYLPGLLKAS